MGSFSSSDYAALSRGWSRRIRYTGQMVSTATLGLLALASRLSAATYYVAANGLDSNPGSQAQPLATIQHALDTVECNNLITEFSVPIKTF